MPRYSHDEIKSRTKLSQSMFHQIEDYLINFMNYVPFDHNHLQVYSLRLVTTILEIGPEVINSFDVTVSQSKANNLELFDKTFRKDLDNLWEREKKLGSKRKSLSFTDYYCFLDDHGAPKLSNATVRLKDFEVYIMPFEKTHPDWWGTYNLLKHDKYNNLKAATLGATLKALAALFWLVDNNSHMFSLGEPFPSNLFVMAQPYERQGSKI